MAEGEPGKYSILELAKVLRDERGSSRKQYWRIVGSWHSVYTQNPSVTFIGVTEG
jgi:hypothetical protein